MQRIYYSFLLSFLFLSAFSQSDFYWIGGSGNWFNYSSHWATSSKVHDASEVIIYESWSYKNDWGGTNRIAKPLTTGPYFYVIDRVDETKVEEGWIYLFN